MPSIPRDYLGEGQDHLRGGLSFGLSFVRQTLFKTPVRRANSINLSKKIRFQTIHSGWMALY